jgi:hypothetical protein
MSSEPLGYTSGMSAEQTEPKADAPQSTQSTVARALSFVAEHPKTSLVVGAGISAIAGLELLAAGFVGGAIALVFRGNGKKG